MSVSAVVLAGGRSTRFGRDKLVEEVDGRPLLWRTIDAVRAVADDIVVVVAPGHDPPLPSGIRIAHDLVAGQGPLVGLAIGLEAVWHDRVLAVGGDMPWLHADVLHLMLQRLDPSVGAVALLVDGRVQQLPLVVWRDRAVGVATRLVEAGERRLGALVETLDPTLLLEVEWRALDPTAATLRDIDVPADLPTSGWEASGPGARVEDAGR